MRRNEHRGTRAVALALGVIALTVGVVSGRAAQAASGPALTEAVRVLLAVPSDADGSGVLLAIVDSGIDSSHPCFAGSVAGGGERRGELDFATNRVVVARSYADADPHELYPGGPTVGTTPTAAPSSMHGTHVAGIAACGDGAASWLDGGEVRLTGVAPAVRLGSYNVFPTPLVDGIGPSDPTVVRAVDDAVRDGADVITMSLSLPSAPATAERAIAVGAVETGWTHEASLVVGAERFGGHVAAGIEVVEPLEAPIAPQVADDTGQLRSGCAAGDVTGASHRIAVVARGQCTFSQKMARAVAAQAAALVIVSEDDADVEPLHVGGPTLPTMIVHPAAGRALMAALGGSARLEPASAHQGSGAGMLAAWSSRGPGPGGRIKPDVLAPGGGVVSAATSDSCAGAQGCARVESGTSMAAPAVAGVVALVRQAHPEWTAAQVRSAVVHTARPLPGATAMEQGSGLVDATAALHARVAIEASAPVLARGARQVVRLSSLTDADEMLAVRVEPTAGSASLGVSAAPQVVTVPAAGCRPWCSALPPTRTRVWPG